jgi:CrcB protein
MKEAFYIFAGSGLGGLTRYGLGRWINTLHTTSFPFGTFVVNVLACFILGFVVGLADERKLISSGSRMFWVIGFCGGFSTFSTFSHETLSLLMDGNHLINIVYTVTSILVCLIATYLGFVLANQV